MELTPKNQRFVEEYLLDLDPRAAARRAGYAAAVGYNLLYKPHIVAAVRAAMDERARRTRISADRVVEALAAIAFSDVRNVMRWEFTTSATVDDDRPVTRYRVRVRDSAHLDPATAAALSEVRRYSSGAVRVKMHDKLGALALLGRHLGLFAQRGDDGVPTVGRTKL